MMTYMTHPLSLYIYPPPIVVKHPFWQHADADFFISIGNLVFELHRRYFQSSPYFCRLFKLYENESLVNRGSSLLTPLPFDDIPESLLTMFLCLLYDEENFTATDIEWHTLKRLCIDWQFAHQTAITIRAIVAIREQQLPRAHRKLLEGFMNRRLDEERNRRRRQGRQLNAILMEYDSDEDESDREIDEIVDAHFA
jgi:hypothetical protein